MQLKHLQFLFHLLQFLIIYNNKLETPCASVYIITVGTPIIKSSVEPNLDYVSKATLQVAKVLRPGNFVILRSTVPVTTTRKIALPILEKESGLKAGIDFDLAFCPERTIEGKALRELRELPQIIGGINKNSVERASKLFLRSTKNTIDVASIEAAEMLKIMDNTYRDVMFSYSNQMALLCEALGLDMTHLVRAANNGYIRNNIPIPSPGVGGACLSKDPYILASVCKKVGIDDSLFSLGRKINESMPLHICNRMVNELNDMGKSIETAEILILGFAFKGNPATSDMRESPTLDLVKILLELGADLKGHDPLVSENEIKDLGVKFVDLNTGIRSAEIIIIMINHKDYASLNLASLIKKSKKQIIIIDGWHLFEPEDFSDHDRVKYLCVGR